MTTQDRFPIIGIGASAGGIEAMRAFFNGFPQSFDAAVIVVTHLNPERESLLTEVLARFTALKVESIIDGVLVQPRHVYVMPPGVTLGIQDARLITTPLPPGTRETKPVDIFFTKLALDQGERVVGVILSGGDGDGAIGVKAIREHGGLTLAQVGDEDGPETPDMPFSAMRTGYIDFGLRASEMGARIAESYLGNREPSQSGFDNADSADATVSEDLLADIYAILRRQVGHDFAGYKPSTFLRRLSRRISVSGSAGPQAYLDLLRANSAEVAALFRDLLIGVTKFFRDAAAFDALAALVIPLLFEGRGPDETIRVWVPACSTGEEVYSIAILLREHADTLPNPPRIQIFATDIDERSLTVARLGRYPRAYLDAVSPERIARHFVSEAESVVISKKLRDMCTFSPHSVLRDPPFSRLDLVSCRNLLIYLGLAAQEQVLPILHYALRPSGYLFIGMAENVTRFENLFATVEKKHRIFQARNTIRPVRLPSMLDPDRTGILAAGEGRRRSGTTHATLRQVVEAEILITFSPPHAVVTRSGEAVHYSPRIGDYLEIASGQPTQDLAAMARRGLRLELRTVLSEAIEGNRLAVRDNLEYTLPDGRIRKLSLIVKPLAMTAEAEPLFLVVFDDAASPIDPTLRRAQMNGEQNEEIARLERELTDARERMQAIVEEYETSLEELKSSNEEMHSVNEEAQSANEELEASKEEVQSINEELHTVNTELNLKIELMDQMSDDQEALFESTELASVFLDKSLRIRSFTRAAADIFNIVPSDHGRLLSNFSAPFSLVWLPDEAYRVMVERQTSERTIDGLDGARYRIRLTATARRGVEVSGVVANFVKLAE
ncbi:CheR family methyltransferase [Methylobacterium sp. 10]|uniref:CheR family methyltransferase n=1 Tax=Methylobacterium sp. 10 TaxID=1101191 RepID=UPI000480B292|nr:CheR family methyltransferase [Methylobacterium sp. 10]